MAKDHDKPARRQRTPEEIARHKAIRDRYQRERPSMEQLLSTGEYDGPEAMGVHLSIRLAVSALKKAREAAGLSLGDVAERCGIDKSALSKIETGQHSNPTVSTLSRYAHALGKRWVWALVDETAPDEIAPGRPEIATLISGPTTIPVAGTKPEATQPLTSTNTPIGGGSFHYTTPSGGYLPVTSPGLSSATLVRG